MIKTNRFYDNKQNKQEINVQLECIVCIVIKYFSLIMINLFIPIARIHLLDNLLDLVKNVISA